MSIQEIHVPDLEGLENVGIVEVYVQIGEHIEVESPLISLESDKAVLDIPSPLAGVIKEIKVSEGDNVNTGDLIATAEIEDTLASASKSDETKSETSEPQEAPASKTANNISGTRNEAAPARKSHIDSPGLEPGHTPKNIQETPQEHIDSPELNPGYTGGSRKFHATPSVRSLARELGVDLTFVAGTGPKNRITRQDLNDFVKKAIHQGASPSPELSRFPIPAIPSEDFSKYGEIFEDELSRIKKISGPHLHNNWLGIPHITQFEESDITEMEEFRQEINSQRIKKGESRISPLIFVIKAVVKALQEFSNFNSSLSADGSRVIRKNYYNIGVAVDTEGGLVVPVVRNADSMGIFALTEEVSRLSSLARSSKLKAVEMQGASFTISSLGGIGGTFFTPIVNAPQSAILGLSRSTIKPIWNGSEFKPRLVLPFSVSYDHRVIDGAEGARFVVYLANIISDIRKIIL